MQESKILQAEEAGSSSIIKSINTDLGPFGNRTDILIVEDGTVRGVSLLECNNPNVKYAGDSQIDNQFDLDIL